jgi:hypothetical protein
MDVTTGIQAVNQHAVYLEVPIGLLMLVGVILIHGFGLRVIARRFNWAWTRVSPQTRRWRLDMALGAVVGSLAMLHLAETLIFALPIAAADLFPTLRDSYYFVLQSYTTLGDTTLALPDDWRLLGPIIAMAGLFTFSWTASVLVTIMGQIGRFDSAQAHEALKEQKAGGDPEKPA